MCILEFLHDVKVHDTCRNSKLADMAKSTWVIISWHCGEEAPKESFKSVIPWIKEIK